MNTSVNDSLTKEIQTALSEDPKNIPLEQSIAPEDSPLNIPVKEKPFPGNDTYTNPSDNEPLDAPEQEIGVEDTPPTNKQSANIPDDYSTLAATAMLGMADNLLAVGSSYFVKIKKDEAFYDYEELIQIIDEQNQKNIKRICLDKDDKELLTPLLAQVLKNKAIELSPEQQLVGAAATILIKKAQVVMEMRSENQILSSRMLEAIQDKKESKTTSAPEYQQTAAEETSHFSYNDTTTAQQKPEPLTDEQIDEMLDAALQQQAFENQQNSSVETTPKENRTEVSEATDSIESNPIVTETPKKEIPDEIPIAREEDIINKTSVSTHQKGKKQSEETKNKKGKSEGIPVRRRKTTKSKNSDKTAKETTVLQKT